VDDADTEEAAFLFDAEAFGEIEGVVVAVPREDAAVAEMFGDVDWLVIAEAERNRGAAIAEALGIANTEKLKARDGEQAVDELREQRHFVVARDFVGGEERAAAIFRCGGWIGAAADFGDVVDGGVDTGDEFLNLRAGFPSIGCVVVGGTHFVRMKFLEQLALAVERAHMRAEKFVRRANEEVGVERADVDGAVWRIVNCVDEHERAGGVRELGDFGDGIDGANGVGGVTDGDEFCFARDFFAEVVEIERAVGIVNIGLTDDDAFFFECAPGRDVGVVIESGDDNFVAGLEITSDRSRECERDRRHVLAEDDFVFAAIEEVGHCGAGGGDHRVVAAAGFEGAASVGVGGEEIIRDGVHDLLGDLGAGGAVEESGLVAVDLEIEGWKLLADPGDVERVFCGVVSGGGAHVDEGSSVGLNFVEVVSHISPSWGAACCAPT
jgi:hypothetical protein